MFYAFVSGVFHFLFLAGTVVKSTPVCLMHAAALRVVDD